MPVLTGSPDQLLRRRDSMRFALPYPHVTTEIEGLEPPNLVRANCFRNSFFIQPDYLLRKPRESNPQSPRDISFPPRLLSISVSFQILRKARDSNPHYDGIAKQFSKLSQQAIFAYLPSKCVQRDSNPHRNLSTSRFYRPEQQRHICLTRDIVGMDVLFFLSHPGCHPETPSPPMFRPYGLIRRVTIAPGGVEPP